MRTSNVLRKSLAVAGWALVSLLLPNVLLRVFAHDRLWASIVLNMMTPYLYVPAYAALAIALAQRRRALALASAIVVFAHAAWTFGPLVRAPREAHAAAGPSGDLRLFSTNVMAWSTTTSGIVEEIARAEPDVVAVQELSPVWAEALASPEMQRTFPYRIEEVHTDASGSGIYSRTPFVDADILRTPSMPVARATLLVRGRPVRIYSVHALPPSHPGWVAEWSRGLSAISEAARAETLPVILAGDFNATPHTALYARFRDAGFEGAHEQCGRALATTWPNGTLPLPPIRLDHVLLSPALRCGSIREGIGQGSDHRPVIAEIRVL